MGTLPFFIIRKIKDPKKEPLVFFKMIRMYILKVQRCAGDNSRRARASHTARVLQEGYL